MTVTAFTNKDNLKKALKRIRQQRLKEIDAFLLSKIPSTDIEKHVIKEINKLKKDVLKNKTEQIGFENLAKVCHTLINKNKSEMQFLKSIETTLKHDFLKRSLTIREYKHMIEPIKTRLLYLQLSTDKLQKLLLETQDNLALFKKVPSFVSAMHKRTIPFKGVQSIALCNIFEKIKVEQLEAIEKEILVKYNITEQELKSNIKKSEKPLLEPYQIEKKMKHLLMLADREKRYLNKERERERAIDIILEFRKYKDNLLKGTKHAKIS
ncbi:MAG: hypothetical protein QXM75_00110 [Candidatus Diapherotrites archaeon]